jgi:ATP-dependent Lon protease
LIDVRISPELIKEHERMLTGGFYAEITLAYDASIAQEKGGRPFGVESLRAIQLSKRDVLESLAAGRLPTVDRRVAELSCSAASASSQAV